MGTRGGTQDRSQITTCDPLPSEELLTLNGCQLVRGHARFPVTSTAAVRRERNSFPVTSAAELERNSFPVTSKAVKRNSFPLRGNAQ